MLYTSPSYARSSSAYSVGLPNMSQFMNTSTMFNGSPKNKFQFNSPVRTYLKTNEIKQRKILHQTVVAKLSDIINSQGSKIKQRKSLQFVSRRCSTLGRTDKNQVLWEALKIKFENEPYNQDLLFDFFQEIQTHSNHVLVEKYNFPITSKQEFTRFKHHFITAFLHEQKLFTIMMKIEQLRSTVLNKISLYAELKGYSTISQIADMLYNQIIRDITLLPFIQEIQEQEFREFTIQLISNLIQQQDNGTELLIKVAEYSHKYNLNHVHFTQLKYTFYKILIEFNISSRAVRKVLKIFDYYKSAILRSKPMRDHINENTNLINEMVMESKNQDQQKRQLAVMFEYITNNHIRIIKKDDIIMMKIDPEIGQQIAHVLQRLKPNQLLFQDFIQDLRSCLSQNYAIPERLVYKFAKRINTIPFYARIYKENQIDNQKLIHTEIDFVSQNRTHFRKKELQLIHKRYNITNEAYDAYIQKIQEVFGVYSQNMMTRLNHYRTWIVSDTNN